MAFHPFEVTIPHIAYAALGGFVVIFGMFSLLIREKLYIGEACLAFVFGVVVGPYGANIFDPRSWGNGDPEVTNQITLEFARVVLAIGVFAIGVELPKAYMARHWKSLFFLLAPVMTWGWFVSAGLIYALVPRLSFLSSLAVAACLTPTDPILAAAVVGGKYADKHVPAHLRHLLAAESGCNDGAAFPFLFIALYLTIDHSTGKAISDWFLLLWLYQVILGTIFGALIGWAFRYLMRFCERKDLVDRQSYVAQYVSLAIFTIGVNTLLGSDDLLAAFACGTAFAWDGFFNKQTEDSVFSSVVDLLFNIAAFVFVGAWMPFDDFVDEELTLNVWRLIVIGILVLLLRRLPIVIALYKFIPDIKTFREAVFSGHFGPMGIGAIFISTLAAETLPRAEGAPESQAEVLAASIQPIVAFMVLVSVTVHGLSIPFFSLGRRVHSISHTWSRRDTYGSQGQPEWAQHTRRITRGEEIVINRDREDAMERGEGADEKQRDSDESPQTPTTEVTRTEKVEDRGETSSETRTEEHAKDENAPDGEETVQEWKEGPHKIIERRNGPGEEVEVEVIKNACADEDKVKSVFRGKAPHVHKSANAYVERLKEAAYGAAEEVEHGAERAEEEVEQGAKTLEHGAKVAGKKAVDSVASPPNDEDEEEGWMSEGSGGEGSSSPSRKEHHRHRSKRSSRHRPSIRRSILARPQELMHFRANSVGADELARARREEEQELDADNERQPRQASLRNRRLDSLRSSHTTRSRDASPARSVRFADEPDSRSGNTTPRSPLTPRRESWAADPPSGGEDDDDSPKTRVTFDLPESRP